MSSAIIRKIQQFINSSCELRASYSCFGVHTCESIYNVYWDPRNIKFKKQIKKADKANIKGF